MRVPLSWLREYADLPAAESGRDVAERLIRAGLEVETVDQVGIDISGPIVVGLVREIEELTGLKKPIRFCRVDVGKGHGGTRGIICGATNFGVGDHVVVALPGAILPGPFAIAARKAYGHISDGMICSERELGLGDDHSGIIVLNGPSGLGADASPGLHIGADAIDLLGVREDVLDIAVTPDRGYCLSVRGVAREAAIAYGVAFRDPAALVDLSAANGPAEPYDAAIEDPTACDRFVLRPVSGFDPKQPSPLWLRHRLHLCGMRSVSLAVDVTNYLTLEYGQPLHAFDRSRLTGQIVVRRARPGERLETLDHVVRDLHPDDILITDSSGPISLAGTMGGLHTEIDSGSTDLVIEGAHFDALGIAKEGRRHGLSSEASRRFERGVDPELPPVAVARAAQLLVELGGGVSGPASEVNLPRELVTITVPASRAGRVAGHDIPAERVVAFLTSIGCAVEIDATSAAKAASVGTRSAPGATVPGSSESDVLLRVTPPSWRPDLTDPADLDEEVIRLEGYDTVSTVLPMAPAGRGLLPRQRLRRRIGRVLAGAGYVEVLVFPFIGPDELDALGLDESDPRRQALRLLNPLSKEQPLLQTTLLPGLLATARRNISRGFADLALFETGLVFRPTDKEGDPAPLLSVARPPTPEQQEELDAALPRQPWRVGVVLTGQWELAGWWGEGRPATWADAIQAARLVVAEAGVDLEVRADAHAPWHPGRCAALVVDDRVVGHAGELHPGVIAAFDLPARSCAMELELDAFEPEAEPVPVAKPISTYPVATQDVALVVADSVPAGEVAAALRDGAGELLESIRLFDVYTGSQIGPGRRSLAFALRFRATDRTLTVEETTAARDAAVAEAARRTGAELRS
jgi:phenylalanyl-tRNA synthetase beta chain